MPRQPISALAFRADAVALAALPTPLLRRAVEIKRLLQRRDEITACEASLAMFLRLAWPSFDSSPYANNWHIDAISEHLMAVSNGQIRRLLVNQPPRTGKACAHDTPVLTTAGWSTHGALRVGDQVFGPDGKPTTVIALSADVDEVVPVSLTNGEVIRCHLNHEWTVTDRAWRGDGVLRTYETRHLMRRSLGGDRAVFHLPPIKPLEFTHASLLLIHPYAFGAWLGDGSSRQARIAHAAQDVAVVDAMVAGGCVISKRRVQATTGVHYADFVGGFYNAMAALKVLGDKHIPEIYLRSSYEQRLQLLAGLIDTDGGVDKTGRVYIATSMPRLRDGIVDLLTTLGQRPYVITAQPRDRERTIRDRKVMFRVCFQPTIRIPTRLVRKQIKILAPQRAVGIRSIGAVERAGARSIQVDRPDGLYLVGKQLNPTHNTNLIAIAWPVWSWALPANPNFPLHGPGVRFLCGSYGANKAEADGVTARRLIGSNWFQDRWGDRVQIAADRDNQGQYDTTAGGSRISTGIPESLGKGGAIRILDDANKVNEVESELVRTGINRAYDEIWRTRSNDPTNGAEVIVAQRLHENDLSGHVMDEADVVHLMLPMEFDAPRRCHTVIGFTDPRKRDGELLWPARFNAAWATKQKAVMGPHAWVGQMQQSPSVRGGGIIQKDWWRPWPPEGQEDSWTQIVEVDGESVARVIYPLPFDFVLVSVDTAYTEKEENDWSGCTVWGSFRLAGMPKIMLIEAWRERMRTRALCMKILDTARRTGREADAVIIEAKANGLAILDEMRRLMRDGEFTLYADVPKGDKVARLHAASPAFSDGLVYAPRKAWAKMVIDEVSQAPRSRWMDLTDSTSAGVNKLRRLGILQHVDEVEAERNEALAFRGNQPSVRQEYGV